MTEDEIKRRCVVRGWAYNQFTAYLVETGLSAYRISEIYDINRQTTSYWIHSSSLTAPINAFWYTMRKIWMMYGVSVDSLF